MSLPRRSQSALEYMMTYGWAILVIVIVAAVLYSLGIFSPSSSLSTTITGFSNLGTVNAVCLGGTSFTISMGDSTGYSINITQINLTSSSGKTTYSPNILIQPNSMQTVTVPSSSLCSPGARYSVSAVISYLEPGQVFQGPYISTGTVAGTANSPPSSATSYEPLTIANTQNQGTPSPFQQMINVTSSDPGWGDISSSPFGQNVEFFSSTGQILDSWLENYTSTHAIWWVKLTSSIPAGSKQTIYMGFASTSTNLFNTNNIGEAPQLSSTYAEYDDGANVFNNYWNFAGTSLPSGWVTGSGISPVVNNGLTISGTNGGTVYYNSFSSSLPFIIEADYYPNPPSEGTGIMAEYGQTGSDMYDGYLFWTTSSFDIYSIEQSASIGFILISSSGTTSQVQQIMSGIISNGYQAFYDNYDLITTGTNNLFSPSQINQIGFRINAGTNIIEDAYWFRVRAYPPNGVMPSVNFGSVS